MSAVYLAPWGETHTGSSRRIFDPDAFACVGALGGGGGGSRDSNDLAMVEASRYAETSESSLPRSDLASHV